MKPFGKIRILCLALVIALGALGGSSAHWQESLFVNALVQTGEVDPVWFFRSCDDPEAEGKDVGTWTVVPDPADPKRETLLVAIGNGYPSYEVYCELHLANNGTIPVKVKEVSVLNPNPEALTVSAVHEEDGGEKVLQPCGFTPEWGTKPNEVPAHCRTEIQLTVHVEAGAEENSIYEFSVEVHLEPE